MSFLVEMDRSLYPDHALKTLNMAETEFDLGNARAMMWLSQLAYETADESKVREILKAWDLEMRAFKSNDPVTGLPPRSACVVVAGGLGATFVSFAGTDPIKVEDWITDFSIRQNTMTLHSGFQAAVESVWQLIEAAIKSGPPQQPLFFAGHSLGGALAIIAAERVLRQLKVRAKAVYTFGSPRTGGAEFFKNYTPELGDSTFRVVHGTDLVAAVPPSLMGDFHHVGRAIRCKTDGLFDAQTPRLPRENDEPDVLQNALQSVVADFRALTSLQLFKPIGSQPLDQFATQLPRIVRDHVPANYFRALSISVRPAAAS
jgi:pimeloyl-ACP methyl ester carboxylesterase